MKYGLKGNIARTQHSHLKLLALCASLPFVWPEAALAEDAAENGEIIVTGVADRQLLLDARTETGSRLGLSVRETPAIVDILSQELMQERGLRTSVEALNATPGATSGELASSPGQMSMRGFTHPAWFQIITTHFANPPSTLHPTVAC